MSNWVDQAARRIDKARRLLRPAVEDYGGSWADLGCGDGVFTYLLCILLQPGSEVWAVDRDRPSLQQLQRNLSGQCHEVHMQTLQADFTGLLPLPLLDGIVLANALHFVKEKQPLLTQLVRQLKPGGRLIVVEYNTRRANYAVPYPIHETDFLALARHAGLTETAIIAKAPSSFLGEMYTGVGVRG